MNDRQPAQALSEYALVLVLVSLAALAVLALLGNTTSGLYETVISNLSGEQSNGIMAIKDDFLARIDGFYAENGNWPRSWGDYRFTDLGLDPADWQTPVEGIMWNPNGPRIGLGNTWGDGYQVYVSDYDGNELHLYDGWNIWCEAGGSGECYYHTVAPGNEVDIRTIRVVEE